MTDTLEMTLTQAAEWAGVGRSTIHKALTGKLKGRSLSGRRDEATGQWYINPAELERAFDPASSRGHTGNVAQADPDTAAAIAGNEREMALLREMVTRSERTADDLREERDRLLTVIERQSLLLVDQREKAATTPAMVTPAPAPAPAASPRPGLFARIKAAVAPPP